MLLLYHAHTEPRRAKGQAKIYDDLGGWKDIERNYGKVLAITSVSENVGAIVKGWG